MRRLLSKVNKDRWKKEFSVEKQMIRTYEEAVNYIMSTPKFTTKNSMEDTNAY